jgi:hypothetical protein
MDQYIGCLAETVKGSTVVEIEEPIMQFSCRESAAATLAPGSKLVAVNGRRWSSELLHRVIHDAAEGNLPIRLLVENSEFFREVALNYSGGERYPHLERVAERADLLTAIFAPRTPQPAGAQRAKKMGGV